jgi:hypothetical protein
VCPITEEAGDYQSLTGDGTFLFWVGAQNRTLFHLRKIRISDMEEVASIQRLNENAYDFVSVSVVGDYVYVGLGYSSTNPITPQILKFNKTDLSYVATLILSEGTPSNFPELYPDPTDSNTLWVGAQDVDYNPIIYKINLSTFSVATYRKYTSDDFNLTGCGGSPAMAIDSSYLYVFMKHGGRFKVQKTNLDNYSNYFQSQYDEFPRRYLHVVDNKIYVVFSSKKISRFDAITLEEDYLYDAFWDDSPYSWVEGLTYFPLHPERIFVVDMEPTSSLWSFRIGSSAFQMLYYWQVPYANSSDIYACWSYTDANGREYVFMADWCGDNPDAIYEVEIKPEIYITAYSVEEPSEILNVNFTINGSNFTTPTTLYVSPADYTFTALNLFPIINGTRYDFKYWLIPEVWNSSRPTITRTITANTTLVIYYHKTDIPTSPEMYSLHVTSEPELNVDFTINYVELTTPATIQIPAGTYFFTVEDISAKLEETPLLFIYIVYEASPPTQIFSSATTLNINSDANLTIVYASGFRREEWVPPPPEEGEGLYCLPLIFWILMAATFFVGLYLFSQRETWKISMPLIPTVLWLIIFKPKTPVNQMPIAILRLFIVPPWHIYMAVILTAIAAIALLSKK